MSRRGSYDSRLAEAKAVSNSKSPGSLDSASAFCVNDGSLLTTVFAVHVFSPLDFVAEESRNLGSVVVSFWPRVATLGGGSDWEVIVIEAEAVVVAPTTGGPASRLPLPCRVIPQVVPVTSHGAFFEVKLATFVHSPTRPRYDLEVLAPLSTAELRDSLPTSYACAKCDEQLVDSSSVLKYNALPSEHWAELMDAWMCHQDQTLSDDLIAKGKGIKPREGEGLVGSSYVVFHRDITRNWSTPEKSEVSDAPFFGARLPFSPPPMALAFSCPSSLPPDLKERLPPLLTSSLEPAGTASSGTPKDGGLIQRLQNRPPLAKQPSDFSSLSWRLHLSGHSRSWRCDPTASVDVVSETDCSFRVLAQVTRSEADDLLSPAHCNTCDSLIGQHVTSLSPSPSPTHLRLLKYATYPLASVASSTLAASPRKELRRYSLSTHVMAEMLEIGQAHACHRFAVEDAETEQVRLLVRSPLFSCLLRR